MVVLFDFDPRLDLVYYYNLLKGGGAMANFSAKMFFILFSECEGTGHHSGIF